MTSDPREFATGDAYGRIVIDGFAIPHGPHAAMMLEIYVNGINATHKEFVQKAVRDAVEKAVKIVRTNKRGVKDAHPMRKSIAAQIEKELMP